MTSHRLAWKQGQATELARLAQKYPVVAVADLNMFPAALFAVIRKKLHGKAEVRVSKLRVAKKAFEQVPRLKSLGLAENLKGSIGLIFTGMNPFELYGFLKKNKGRVSAKAGMIAPEDIVIPAGPTPLPPGPALSDLKNAGLKVKIAGPTIEITEEKRVTHAGEAIIPAVASVLSELDIKPVKVGMNLSAVVEGTQLYNPAVLDIDEEKVFMDFMTAHAQAFGLALEIAYLSTATIEPLLGKAVLQAKTLALDANILSHDTVEAILGKASLQAKALQDALPPEGQ